MRKLALVAGLAAAALIPSLAAAQPSCEQHRDNRVVSTVAGAGIGALLGSAIARHRDRTTGAVVGLGGAIVGNQVSKPNADCAHAYSYYDRNNPWHANAVDRANAAGYYDRDGAGVDQSIRSAGADGTLSRRDMRRDLSELKSIRRQETNMRYSDGELPRRDEVYLQARLDRLGASLRLALNERPAAS